MCLHVSRSAQAEKHELRRDIGSKVQMKKEKVFVTNTQVMCRSMKIEETRQLYQGQEELIRQNCNADPVSHKAVESLDERNAVYINVLSDAGIESNKAFSN